MTVDPPQDPLRDPLAQYLEPRDMAVLDKAASEIGAFLQRLSDEDVQRIANAVSAKVISTYGAEIDASSRATWQKRISDVTYQLALGVAGSGLYALLANLVHSYMYFDSAEDADLALQRNERAAAMARLSQRVDATRRGTFSELMSHIPIAQHFGISMQRQLSRHSDIMELEQKVVAARQAELPKPRRSVRDFITGRPLPPPQRVAFDNEVASSIAALLLRSLEEDAAARAGEPNVS